MDFFSKELQNEFETAVVIEPLVFEPMKFYCMLIQDLFHVVLLPCWSNFFGFEIASGGNIFNSIRDLLHNTFSYSHLLDMTEILYKGRKIASFIYSANWVSY